MVLSAKDCVLCASRTASRKRFAFVTCFLCNKKSANIASYCCCVTCGELLLYFRRVQYSTVQNYSPVLLL